jgi:hypothetical protein
MKHRFLTLVGAFVCAAALAAPKLLENIPLKWSPTQGFAELGPVDVSGPLLTAKIHFEPFSDTRQNPYLIAENREKAQPRPVTTNQNVADFVTLHLKDTVHGAGVNVVEDGGDVSVSGEISEFFVAETNQYHGNLSMLVHVKVKGKEVWSGVITGAAENFGRSYKADNYYETISNMVQSAAHNLLASAAFHDAVTKR